MSDDPRRNIMKRYSQRAMAQDTESCHYDNLREHGFPKAEARRIAKEAADVTQRSLDGQQDALAGGSRGIGSEGAATKGKAPATPWLRWADD